MFYNNRTGLLRLLLAGLVLAGATAPVEAANRKQAQMEGREMVVTCTSGVVWDVGPCTAQAFGRCKGSAQLLGALSSTYLAANKLHQISARYRCGGR